MKLNALISMIAALNMLVATTGDVVKPNIVTIGQENPICAIHFKNSFEMLLMGRGNVGVILALFPETIDPPEKLFADVINDVHISSADGYAAYKHAYFKETGYIIFVGNDPGFIHAMMSGDRMTIKIVDKEYKFKVLDFRNAIYAYEQCEDTNS